MTAETIWNCDLGLYKRCMTNSSDWPLDPYSCRCTTFRLSSSGAIPTFHTVMKSRKNLDRTPSSIHVPILLPDCVFLEEHSNSIGRDLKDNHGPRMVSHKVIRWLYRGANLSGAVGGWDPTEGDPDADLGAAIGIAQGDTTRRSIKRTYWDDGSEQV